MNRRTFLKTLGLAAIAKSIMNNPTSSLATISNDGKVPYSRITNPYEVQQFVNRLIIRDNKRSYKRARLNGLVDGEPPFSRSKLRDLGRAEATNANFGGARAYMESGTGAIYDLASEAPGYFDVQTSYGTAEEIVEWSRIMSGEADRVFKDSKVWDYNLQKSIWDMVLHGCGPLMFEDAHQVLPRAFLCDDLKVPENAESETFYWDAAAVLVTYYPPQLFNFIENEKVAESIGWNVEHTKKIIASAMNLRVAQSSVNNWVFIQQQLKNNSASYYDDSLVCRVAHVFWKEFDGRITHVMVEIKNASADKVDFLFRSVGRFASWTEVIHPMYWDHGNAGYHHSVTGLGVKMYSAMVTQNRMLCNGVDKAVAPKILFKPTTTESSQKFSMVSFGDYGVLPAGFDWGQTGVAGLMNDVLAMNNVVQQTMDSNLSSYRQPVREKTGNPETAAQYLGESEKEATLGKTSFNRFYRQLDSLYEEIFRRLRNPNSTDRIAQDFQARCKKLGVPPEALGRIVSVRAVRIIGQGSSFMRRQALQQGYLTVGPGLPEDGRQNMLDDIVATSFGAAAVSRYNPKTSASTLPNDQVAEATQWLGNIKLGLPPTVTSSQNPVIFAQVWTAAAGQAVQSIQQGSNPLEILTFLETIGPAIAKQLARFGNDPTRQQIGRQLEQVWKQLAKATDQLKMQLQKQQQEQAKQAQKTQTVMTDDQLAEMETQADIQRKNAVTQARLAQSQQKHQLSIAQKGQNLQLAGQSGKLSLAEQVQKLTLNDLLTAADIRLQHEKAKAETETATP